MNRFAITCLFRRLHSTALLAATVLLFSPVFPSFALSGKWLILLATVLPSIASLVWINERTQRAAVATSALG